MLRKAIPHIKSAVDFINLEVADQVPLKKELDHLLACVKSNEITLDQAYERYKTFVKFKGYNDIKYQECIKFGAYILGI